MKLSSTATGMLYAGILSFIALWLIAERSPSAMTLALALAVCSALLLPVVFLVAKQQIREKRMRAAKLLNQRLAAGVRNDVYFEFIPRKYFETNRTRAADESSVPLICSRDWITLFACMPFILLVAAGLCLLFIPAQQLPNFIRDSLGASIVGGDVSSPKGYEAALSVAAFAFAGGFLYSLRLFLKTLSSFTFTAATPLKAFAHVVSAVAIALALWSMAPDMNRVTGILGRLGGTTAALKQPTPNENMALEASTQQTAPASVPKIWLLIAFAIGFLPDPAFSRGLRTVRFLFDRRDAALARHARVTPLTVLDGIDYSTAYRLNQGGIANVQNLACANPVMVHVETPYCIVTVMDWIAQAQLCATVGAHRFLLLRKLNVRTIIDLEHAVLDPSAPLGLKQMVGSVLIASDGKSTVLRDFGIRPYDFSSRDIDRPASSWSTVEVTEHLVRMILNELFVQRFRQFWLDMEASLHLDKSVDKPVAVRKITATAGIAASGVKTNGYANGQTADASYSRRAE